MQNKYGFQEKTPRRRTGGALAFLIRKNQALAVSATSSKAGILSKSM
jgi:hypothetical protein